MDPNTVIKFLLVAVVCSVIAVIVMIIGVVRYNRILKIETDIAEEKIGNKKKAQKVFLIHTVISIVFIIAAIIIRITSGGVGR